MKLLLDTHAALWLINEYEKLSSKVASMLTDEANELYISIISAWEIAIKASIGKLSEFDGGSKAFLAQIDNMPINIITVLPEHIGIVETLPFHHRDPFDRLIIATAKAESMAILTSDENIQKYDVSCIW